MTSPRRTTTTSVPTDCWYALARSADVDDEPLGLRALGLPVVVFRTADGRAVALEDRCAHRAYPLSTGVVVDAGIRCGLCGFVYDADGQCVSVPTQISVQRLGAFVMSAVRLNSTSSPATRSVSLIAWPATARRSAAGPARSAAAR